MTNEKYFNIRVYGLMINELSEILVADEFHYNTFMRKFPGGGLQFGEGTKECLIREIKEELNLDIAIEELFHFHTTDFFAQSVFNREHQVIGIYYLLKTPVELNKNFREAKDTPVENGAQHFHWMALAELQIEKFTFPVDKQVVLKLVKRYTSGELLIT